MNDNKVCSPSQGDKPFFVDTAKYLRNFSAGPAGLELRENNNQQGNGQPTCNLAD